MTRLKKVLKKHMVLLRVGLTHGKPPERTVDHEIIIEEMESTP